MGKTTIQQQLTLNNHVSVGCTCAFRYGTTHGPARQIHEPAHVIVGPAHIEPVFHGPRCHVMGRAGPGRAKTFEKMIRRAGPGREFLKM